MTEFSKICEQKKFWMSVILEEVENFKLLARSDYSGQWTNELDVNDCLIEKCKLLDDMQRFIKTENSTASKVEEVWG